MRKHVAGCAGCRRVLREMERAEDLLRRLPGVLMPLEPSSVAESHLASLARWAPARPAPDPPAFAALPALSAFALATLLAFVFWSTTWTPIVDAPSPISMAFAMADADMPPPGNLR